MKSEFEIKIDNLCEIEEMVCHTYKGISCKICGDTGFGRLFRTANKTLKSNYGCYKCIMALLENSFTNDSDKNKKIQDLINELKTR